MSLSWWREEGEKRRNIVDIDDTSYITQTLKLSFSAVCSGHGLSA